MNLKSTDALDLVRVCCRVLDEKKAGDLAVLDVSEQSSITDYLILATATSEPHLRALRVELEKALDDAEVHLVGQESAQESGWLVIDAFDVMVHLFLAATRERYGLERLWRDAKEVNVDKLLKPQPIAKTKKTAKRPPAKAAKPRKPRGKKS
jgi:ribosome-associated protein